MVFLVVQDDRASVFAILDGDESSFSTRILLMSSSQDITGGFLTVSICAMDVIIQSSPLMALMFIEVSESLLAKRG